MHVAGHHSQAPHPQNPYPPKPCPAVLVDLLQRKEPRMTGYWVLFQRTLIIVVIRSAGWMAQADGKSQEYPTLARVHHQYRFPRLSVLTIGRGAL
ncbi:hypothetical protein PGTUg99_011676 [Puccinia graminis f. sp. tritici]|uniref:Uncharacterized protein n=1 Tax=Puccinia graminis f. sp. tritici TaxID=56615 RepID=A0A5B0RM89_PUCGR|nr:hypothetical protein PGTUg99_011676 [Puccinia graminis f. sp. tritici]